MWRKCTEDLANYRYFGTESWGEGSFITNERNSTYSSAFEATIPYITRQSSLFSQNAETNKWIFGRFTNTNPFWL